MHVVVTVLVALIPLSPLLACLICGMRRAQHARWSLWGSGLAFATSATVLTLMLLGPSGKFQQSTTLWQWASVPDPSLTGDGTSGGLDVVFGIQADELSAVFLCAVTFAVLLVTLHSRRAMSQAPEDGRFHLALLCSEFAAVMALLSTNFLELLFFWELTAVAGWGLLTVQDDDWGRAIGSKVWLVLRAADVFTVFGVYLIWRHFGSLDLSAVLGGSPLLAEVVDRNAAAVTLIGLCLFAGAAGRCAQFPLFGWLHDASRASAKPASGLCCSVNALLQAATLMPLGVYLIVRLTPLYEASPDGRLLMAFVGAFTALLAAAVAVTQLDLQQVLSYTTSSHFGLMFLGLGSGRAVGLAGAVFLAVVHLLLKTSLFLASGTVAGGSRTAESGELRAESETRHIEATSLALCSPPSALCPPQPLPSVYWSFLAAVVMLVCGLWGQNAVLDGTRAAMEQPPIASPAPAEDSPRMVLFAAEPARLYQAAYWLGTASLVLVAFALFRALLLTFCGEADGWYARPLTRSGDRATTKMESLSLWLGPMAVVLLGFAAATAAGVDQVLSRAVGLPLTPGEPGGSTPRLTGSRAWGEGGAVGVFQWDVHVVLVLLGAVCAWVLYARPMSLPQRLADALGPFTRLSRNRFYLDDFLLLCVVLPIRGLAQVLRFFDWLVIDGLLVGLPSRLAALLVEMIRPLQHGAAQFDALSLLLAVGVLLAVMYWLFPTL